MRSTDKLHNATAAVNYSLTAAVKFNSNSFPSKSECGAALKKIKKAHAALQRRARPETSLRSVPFIFVEKNPLGCEFGHSQRCRLVRAEQLRPLVASELCFERSGPPSSQAVALHISPMGRTADAFKELILKRSCS